MVSDEDRTPCSKCEHFIKVLTNVSDLPCCMTGDHEAEEIDTGLIVDLELGYETCSDFERKFNA